MFTLHTNGFLKLTIAFIDVLESIKRVLLKFPEKCSMTQMLCLNHNSSSRGNNGLKSMGN